LIIAARNAVLHFADESPTIGALLFLETQQDLHGIIGRLLRDQLLVERSRYLTASIVSAGPREGNDSKSQRCGERGARKPAPAWDRSSALALLASGSEASDRRLGQERC
jgi:hypothetical protein